MNAREFAERALLGALMSQPDGVTAVGNWLLPEDFYAPAHGTIFRHLTEMVSEARGVDERGDGPLDNVNAVTLYRRIASSGDLGAHAITGPRLHTLLAAAPPAHLGQPETYGLMVLEASIRRRVEHGGMRVGQHVDQAADVGSMLGAVDAALAEVEHAQHRWAMVTARRVGPHRVGNPDTPERDAAVQTPVEEDVTGGAGLPLLVEVPDQQQLHAAEETVVSMVLANPRLLGQLQERLVPEDFADPELANTYRAAVELHARREHVDMVTVAWEQQRHERQHGSGITPERMLDLVSGGVVGDAAYNAEIVMRGSLARLTAAAAETVQSAARHPGLQPTDLLHTTRLAYQAVRSIAARHEGKNEAALLEDRWVDGARPAQLAGQAHPRGRDGTVVRLTSTRSVVRAAGRSKAETKDNDLSR